jgi:hypothetical protein
MDHYNSFQKGNETAHFDPTKLRVYQPTLSLSVSLSLKNSVKTETEPILRSPSFVTVSPLLPTLNLMGNTKRLIIREQMWLIPGSLFVSEFSNYLTRRKFYYIRAYISTACFCFTTRFWLHTYTHVFKISN